MNVTVAFRRLVAFYIDGIVISIIMICLILIYHSFKEVPIEQIENLRSSDWLMIQGFSIMAYFIFFEYFLGITLGKKVMKFKIVGLPTKKFDRFISVFLRTIIRLIPLDPFSIFLNEEGIMWHDKISKTKVIDIRNKNKE